MTKKIFASLAYALVWLFTLLPLPVLYVISTTLYFINYYVVGYRKKVVLKNLKNALPNLPDDEINKIAKSFYKHLSDLLIETIKSIHLSKTSANKRMTYKNHELFQKYFDENKDVTIILGHYANWEWLNNFPEFAPHKTLVLYQPLNSRFSDMLIKRIRSKFGLHLIPMHDAYKEILDHKKNNIRTITWFLGDQRPPSSTSFWTKFLNQETGFYVGAEKIAKKLNHAVVFMNIQKKKRGYYETEFIELFSEAKNAKEFEITSKHVKTLENIIKEKPDYWLWSHNRWKHKRPENRAII